MLPVCVESGVGAHVDDATLAWAHDVRWWGLCGQGVDEGTAMVDLTGRAADSYARFLSRHSLPFPPLDHSEIVERIHGDEQAFARDRQPATDAELEATTTILDRARRDLSDLVHDCSDAELDFDDPQRELPAWATWRTLRQMAWHVVDTESRYYLAVLGFDPTKRAANLPEELQRSHEHVLTVLRSIDPGHRVRRGEQRWTTRKVLRRLAWHERAELDAMYQLRERARRATS